jgi:hypothetical protein
MRAIDPPSVQVQAIVYPSPAWTHEKTCGSERDCGQSSASRALLALRAPSRDKMQADSH